MAVCLQLGGAHRPAGEWPAAAWGEIQFSDATHPPQFLNFFFRPFGRIFDTFFSVSNSMSHVPLVHFIFCGRLSDIQHLYLSSPSFLRNWSSAWWRKATSPHLIFVTSITSGACGGKLCHVETNSYYTQNVHILVEKLYILVKMVHLSAKLVHFSWKIVNFVAIYSLLVWRKRNSMWIKMTNMRCTHPIHGRHTVSFPRYSTLFFSIRM